MQEQRGTYAYPPLISSFDVISVRNNNRAKRETKHIESLKVI